MATRSPRRALAAAAAIAAIVLGATACTEGTAARVDDQSQGVNVQLAGVKVRDLAVVAKDGKGFLTGALVGSEGDQLTSVSATALQPDGTDAGPVSVTSSAVDVPANKLVDLSQAGIALSSASLKPGLTTRLVLTFAKAGALTVLTPVLSSDHPDYATVSAKAVPSSTTLAPSGSASAKPSGSASASGTPSASGSASGTASASGTPSPSATTTH